MTSPKVRVREAVESALGSVPFDPPISVEYCAAVRDAIRAALPSASIDVFHRLTELVVDVRVGDVTYATVVPLV